MPARVDHRVCVELTSKYMPFWSKPEDRRYYILNADTEGYALVPRAEEFAAQVCRREDWSVNPAIITRPYEALMAPDLSQDFLARTHDVEIHCTEVMRQIFGNGWSMILDGLKELLDARKQNAIP